MAGFAELARHLTATGDPEQALAQVLDYAVVGIPACDGASVTLWRDGSVFDTLATSRNAANLDKVQFLRGSGPAWSAMQDGCAVPVADLAHDARWPAMAIESGMLGVSAVLCHGLLAEQDRPGSAFGCFTLSSHRPRAFGDEDREVAIILSAYLTMVVASFRRAREIDRREAALHRALSSRDVIGQAKGILMEREGCTAPEAFDALRRASQRLNLRLVDLAEQLAQTPSMAKVTGQAPRRRRPGSSAGRPDPTPHEDDPPPRPAREQ